MQERITPAVATRTVGDHVAAVVDRFDGTRRTRRSRPASLAGGDPAPVQRTATASLDRDRAVEHSSQQHRGVRRIATM
jgi:hypothetical protein